MRPASLLLSLLLAVALPPAVIAYGRGVAEPSGCTPAATAVTLVDPTVVGSGTPGSVTTAAIQAALDAGGHVTFDVGAAPATIVVASTLVVSKETVLDGGGLVTLSGGGARRVIQITNPANVAYTLTLQRLGIADGATPAGSGAGVHKPTGGPWQAVSLAVIESRFTSNVAIATAQDDGGGAIYAVGMDEVRIHASVFESNRGSNGGAIYSLGSRVVQVSDSTFYDNRATGTGGNPGNGGNAGAIGVDGAERQVTLCGIDLLENRANAFGAGFFSVMYDALSSTTFDRSLFQGNLNPTASAFAGGAYLQGGPFTIRDTTFDANEAEGVGGVFLGPGATGSIVNSTFHANLARTGLGGALFVSTAAPVALTQVTIAGNLATGPGGFAAGIQVDAVNAVTMKNSLLVANVGGNAFNPWNIRNPVGDGGGNLQWPPTRPNGQAEVPATASVVFADPLLAPLGFHGGPTPTQPLTPGSVAVDFGVVAGAPPNDQRGLPRVPPPDAGAVEGSSPVVFCDGFESGTTTAWSGSVG